MSKIVNYIPAKLKAKTVNIKIDSQFKTEFADGLGFSPFVWYNRYLLESYDINFLELSHVDGIPTVKLTFRDGKNVMRDQAFPLDDTKITIFLNPRTTQLKPIHMDFKIIDFKINLQEYTCVGVLDVNKLYVKEFKSYKKSSSYDVLSKICRELGLGFNSNVQSSNDKMTWINTGNKIQHFMEQVIENSYLSDQGFVLGYIDWYYSYNYVDLQKELTRDIKTELGIMNNGLQTTLKLENKEATGRLLLTNDNGFTEGNSYFENYKIINKSTGISIQSGYKSIIKYYNHLSKEYLTFDLDSITDNSNSKIILKGAPKDMSFKNDNLNYIYKGKLDDDNMHINYSYAKVHNDRNLFDLEKIGLEVQMKTPNFNLYKFQKILVLISNQDKGIQQEYYNQRLSGEWLIIDIKFRLSDAKFTQVITLVKRELEVSKAELGN